MGSRSLDPGDKKLEFDLMESVRTVRVDLGYRVPVSGGGRQNERRSPGLISRALGSIATRATQCDSPIQQPPPPSVIHSCLSRSNRSISCVILRYTRKALPQFGYDTRTR